MVLGLNQFVQRYYNYYPFIIITPKITIIQKCFICQKCADEGNESVIKQDATTTTTTTTTTLTYRPIHIGRMHCNCGHGIGECIVISYHHHYYYNCYNLKKSSSSSSLLLGTFPLDRSFYHASGSCMWDCCNDNWDSPGCSQREYNEEKGVHCSKHAHPLDECSESRSRSATWYE